MSINEINSSLDFVVETKPHVSIAADIKDAIKILSAITTEFNLTGHEPVEAILEMIRKAAKGTVAPETLLIEGVYTSKWDGGANPESVYSGTTLESVCYIHPRTGSFTVKDTHNSDEVTTLDEAFITVNGIRLEVDEDGDNMITSMKALHDALAVVYP
jgi:hypothetical protein